MKLFLMWLMVLVTWMSASVSANSADTYPDRPVRLFISGPPGSGTDMAFRILVSQLSERLGQPFIVENRPGAGGNIGLAYGARQKPDGYSLIAGFMSGLAMNQFMYSPAELGFDPEKDIDPIVLTGSIPMVIAVAATSPYNTLQDLIDAAKAKPDTINVANTTATSRVMVELLARLTQARLFQIPFSSPPSAINALLGNQVDVLMDTTTAIRSLVQTGRVRALAVTSEQRTELLPGVPTAREQGVNEFVVVAWNVLAVATGTPPEIKEKLRGAVKETLRDPVYRARLIEMGFEPSTEQANARPPNDFVRAERAKWGKIITESGIRP